MVRARMRVSISTHSRPCRCGGWAIGSARYGMPESPMARHTPTREWLCRRAVRNATRLGPRGLDADARCVARVGTRSTHTRATSVRQRHRAGALVLCSAASQATVRRTVVRHGRLGACGYSEYSAHAHLTAMPSLLRTEVARCEYSEYPNPTANPQSQPQPRTHQPYALNPNRTRIGDARSGPS